MRLKRANPYQASCIQEGHTSFGSTGLLVLLLLLQMGAAKILCFVEELACKDVDVVVTSLLSYPYASLNLRFHPFKGWKGFLASLEARDGICRYFIFKLIVRFKTIPKLKV